MSQLVFYRLLQLVRPSITKKDTNWIMTLKKKYDTSTQRFQRPFNFFFLINLSLNN